MADIDEKDRSRDSGRDRDRSRRGDRPSRFSEGSNVRDRSGDRGGNDRGGRKSSSSRVYVSNISYEYRWQDLKDLFREKVGDVAFVELFVDDHDKPKGCGIVEFSDSASVKKCMEVMHRFELNGRKLVIKEDFGNERDKFGNIINGRRNRDRERQMDKLDWDDMRDNRRSGGGGGNGGGNTSNWDHHHHHSNPPSLMNLINKEPLEYKWGNTYGLSPQFLESLNINRPLVNRVFVANLDYKVDEKKLREVFKLCGKVCDVELYHDKDGNSRGFAVVEFDHPVESVQAISMLHNQMLYERPMIVRMDRIDHDVPPKLPEGLKGIGMGLGMNWEPLRDVSRNLPSQNGGNNMGAAGGGGGNGGGSGGSGGNSGAGILGAMPNQQSLQALGSTAAALSSVVNNSTLAGLSGTSAAALQASLAGVQAPFLNQLGGNLGNSLGNNLNSDIGLGNLTSSNLSSLSTSLAQNHALASLASGNSMGGGSTGNLTSSLMARGLVGNSDRDYSRNDNSGNTSGYMMSSAGNSSNQQSNSNQSMVGNRGGASVGGGGGGIVNDYSSSNARDYDSNASMRSQYDDMQDSFRQQTSIYSTVNNGSQNRAGSNNMNNTKGNGYSDTIIVSNLPISATWKMMREKFSNVGDVQFVDMKPKDNQAIIRFSSEWHAERAIKLMDRQRIDGRTIDVRFCY